MKEPIRNSIKILTHAYYDYERERIALDNRLGLKKNGEIKKQISERDDHLLTELYARRKEVAMQEQTIHKVLAKEIHQHPLWNVFLAHVKGCGETIAAIIISEFDIHKATTVSNLWSFAGLAPGKDRKVSGKKCPFNQFLRAKLCGVLGSSFLKCNSPYRVYYDNMKDRLAAKDWGKASPHPVDKNKPKAGHQHRAANRYMVKMFLRGFICGLENGRGPISASALSRGIFG